MKVAVLTSSQVAPFFIQVLQNKDRLMIIEEGTDYVFDFFFFNCTARVTSSVTMRKYK